MVKLPRQPRRHEVVTRATASLLAVGCLAFVGLSLPAGSYAPAVEGAPTPFRWDAASLFEQLEIEFDAVRALPLAEARTRADALEVTGASLLERVAAAHLAPLEDLGLLAALQFQYAVLGAAHPTLLGPAESFINRSRITVMRSAAAWPADRATHEGVYRVLFGGRIALEEALVQAGPVLSELMEVESIPSATPSLEVQGVRVHSGDILLSRGGAPTSALIARGSDFANTFSHAALAHVDPETGVGTVVESLIETGTVLTSVEEYLEGKKHRILVLRLRPDHSVDDPLLPHRAATRMLEQLRDNPADYDFGMAWHDPERMFCSEVIYHAYAPEGVELWSHRSAMTSSGLVRWLASLGVREFRTLVPSDLEYDARLGAVVEWRNLEALTDYRLDNAITDVLLEEADRGADLEYRWFALPATRLLKGASVVLGMLGWSPVIPTGMSTDAALRIRALVSEVSPTMKATLIERERDFEQANGFRAPYWTLVELARASLEDNREVLGASLR